MAPVLTHVGVLDRFLCLLGRACRAATRLPVRGDRTKSRRAGSGRHKRLAPISALMVVLSMGAATLAAPTTVSAQAAPPVAQARASALAPLVAQNLPQAPSGVAVDRNLATGAAEVTWTKPSGASVSGWQYRTRTGAGADPPAWTTVPGADSNTTSFALAIGEFPHGAQIQLRAVNGPTAGSPSGWVSVDFNNAASTQRINGFQVLPSHEAAVVFWDSVGSSATTYDPQATYQVKHYETGNQQSQSAAQWQTVTGTKVDNSNSHRHTLSSLVAGTSYTVELRAQVAEGNVHPRAQSLTVTPAALPPPTAITGLELTYDGQNFNLEWDQLDAADFPNGIFLWLWQARRAYDGRGFGSWRSVTLDPPPSGNSLGLTSTSGFISAAASFESVRLQLRYVHYVLGDTDVVDTTESSDVIEFSLGSQIQVDAVPGNSQIDLFWDSESDSNVVSWEYWISPGSSRWQSIPQISADNGHYRIDGLTNKTRYTLRVRPVLSGGLRGPESAFLQARPFGPEQRNWRPQTVVGDGQIALSWQSPFAAPLDAVQVRIGVAGEQFDAWQNASSADEHTFSSLTNGIDYAMQIRGVLDGTALAESPEIVAAPRKAGAPAAFGAIDTIELEAGVSTSVRLPAVATGIGNFTYNLAPLPDGLRFDAGSRTLSGTPTATGATSTLYSATGQGAMAASKAIDVVVATLTDTAPSFGTATVAPVGLHSGVIDESPALPEASGGNGELSYTLSPRLPAGLSFDPENRRIQGRAHEAAPTRTYTLTAHDADPNTTDTAQLPVTLTVYGPASFDPSTARDLNLTAGELMTPVVLPSAVNAHGITGHSISPALPDGVNFDAASRTLSGTPAQPSATRHFLYRATGAAGQHPQSEGLRFTIDVNAAGDGVPAFPADASVQDTSISVGDSVQVTLPAAQPRLLRDTRTSDASLTYSLSPALPDGLTFDSSTRTISGTATTATPPAVYTYAASDGDPDDPESATVKFRLQVLPAKTLTFRGLPPARSVPQGVPLSPVRLPNVIGGDAPYTYSVRDLPTGLTFDPDTRWVSGTPRIPTRGVNPVMVATDAAGRTAEYSWALTVNARGHQFPQDNTVSVTFKVGADSTHDLPQATGGPASGASYTFEVLDGDMPPTFTLEGAAAGVTTPLRLRSHNPTSTGQFTLKVYAWQSQPTDRLVIAAQSNSVFHPDPSKFLADELIVEVSIEGATGPLRWEASTFDDIELVAGQEVKGLTLPLAIGGSEFASYFLSGGLPTGLSFDSSTRVISGTPQAATATRSFLYAASAGGSTIFRNFAITVNADTEPSFPSGRPTVTLFLDRDNNVNLPRVSNGNAPYTYELSPGLPTELMLSLERERVRIQPPPFYETRTNEHQPTIAGQPLEKYGTKTYQLRVTDIDGDSASTSFRLATDIAPSGERDITFGNNPIPDIHAVLNEDVGKITLPYANPIYFVDYSIAPSLPQGLQLITELTDTLIVPRITGTPTETAPARTYVFTAEPSSGSDFASGTDSLQFTLSVSQDTTPAFTKDRQGIVMEPRVPIHDALPQATGGNEPISYAITPRLPSGLTLTDQGQGPLLVGELQYSLQPVDYTLTATDVHGQSDSTIVTLSAADSQDAARRWSFEQPEITEIEFERDREGLALLPQATGGFGDVTYRVIPDLLTGLTLRSVDSVGQLVPTIEGISESSYSAKTYWLQVLKDDQVEDESFFTISVNPPSDPLRFVDTAVRDVVVFAIEGITNAFSEEFVTAGGVSPVALSFSPEFPDGLHWTGSLFYGELDVPADSAWWDNPIVFNVVATDSTGDTAEVTMRMHLSDGPPASGVTAQRLDDHRLRISWDSVLNPYGEWQIRALPVYPDDYPPDLELRGWNDVPDDHIIRHSDGRSSFDDSSALDGLGYEYRVRYKPFVLGPEAVFKWSEWSTATAIVPTKLVAQPGDESVVLEWPAHSNNRGGWEYRYRSDGSYGNWVPIPGSDATTTRHLVTGLHNGTSYTFEVRGRLYSGGYGPASATPVAVPDAPVGVAATAGEGSITVSWGDPATDGPTVTDWEYAYGVDLGAHNTEYNAWTSLGSAAARQVTLTQLVYQPGLQYRLKVRAVGASGAGPSAASVVAQPLLQGVTATPTGAAADVSWNDPTANGVNKWQYQITEGDAEFGTWTDLASADATTAEVDGLRSLVQHRLRVRGVDSQGTAGAPSPVVTVTPLLTLAALAESGTSVRLDWNDPGDQSATAWHWRVDTGNGQSAWSQIPGAGSATRTHTVTGLASGVKHTFQVRAEFAGSNFSAASQLAEATTGQILPAFGISSIPDQAWGVGKAVSVTMPPVTRGTQPVTYTFTPAPAKGLTFDPQTRVLSGTPTEESLITHTYTATTTFGDTTSLMFTIRTFDVPAAPPALRAESGANQVTLRWGDVNAHALSKWQVRGRDLGIGAQGPTTPWGVWLDVTGGAAARSHAVTGLQAGLTYEFEVRAVNPNGNGAASSVRTALSRYLPAAPTGVTAVPGDERVTLRWDATADASVGTWEYRQATGNGDFGSWQTAALHSVSTHATLEGLTNGTPYRFQLRAVNGLGAGPASVTVSATPSPPVPSAPETVVGLTATAGDGSVTLNWQQPAAGAPEISGFEVRYSVNYAPFTAWLTLSGVGPTDTSHTVTGLTNNAVHRFQLRAVNTVGSSDPSPMVTATPMWAAPGPPTNLVATPGDGRVRLSWTAPQGVSEITRWELRQRQGSSPWGDWVALSGTDLNTVSHTVLGLVNQSAYSFQLRALNPAGVGTPSAVVTATPVASLPDAPQVSAIASYAAVALSWPAVSNVAEITRFEVRWRASGGAFGNWAPITGSGLSTTSHQVTGLTNGTTYEFEVRAVNSVGNGASGSATAAPFDTAPAFDASLGDTLKLRYLAGDTIKPYVLPEASGGNGDLSYSLTGTLPGGLNFNSSTRTISGTVTDISANNTLTWVASDDDPNTAATDQASISVNVVVVFTDRAPSRPAPISNQFWTVGVPVSLVLPASSGGNGDLSYTLGGTLPAGLGVDLATRTISGTPTTVTAATELTWTVTDADTDEPESASRRFLVQVEPVAPDAPVGLSAYGYGTALVVSWAPLGEPSVLRFEYRVREGQGAFGGWTAIPGSSATTTVATISSLALGVVHTVEVRAVNRSGNGAAGSVSGTPVADTAPTFATTAPQAGVWLVGDPVSLALPAVSGGNGPISFTWTPALPNGIAFDAATMTLSGTPTAAASGDWTLTVADADASVGATDEDTLSLNIRIESGSKPTFAAGAGIDPLALVVNTPMTAVVLPVATGGNGSISYRFDPALPAGLSFDAATSTLSGTPTVAQATTTYQYVAADSDTITGVSDESALSFTITVGSDGVPRFTSAAPDIAVEVNTALATVQLPFTVGGNSPITYGLTPVLPTGLVFNPKALTISGTPTATLDQTEFTLVAVDGDGDAAITTFTVTVQPPNRVPTVTAAIADVTVTQGDSHTLALEAAGAAVFTDPDGDTLTYTASSADPAKVTVAVETSTKTVTVTGAAVGSAEVTVTATDTRAATATDVFTVTVVAPPPPNRAPVVVRPVASQSMRRLSGYVFLEKSGAEVFNEPDGDDLTYTVTIADTNVASVQMSHWRVHGASINVEGKNKGTTTVTVTASDGRGGTVEMSFSLEVVTEAPRVYRRIPDQVVVAAAAGETDNSTSAALADRDNPVFIDRDVGDWLTYSAASSDSGVVTATINSSKKRVVVTGVAAGVANVTVTATDRWGDSASDVFEVRVVARPDQSRTPTPTATATGNAGEVLLQWVRPQTHAPCKVTEVLIRVFDESDNYFTQYDSYEMDELDGGRDTSWLITGLTDGESYEATISLYYTHRRGDGSRACDHWSQFSNRVVVTSNTTEE